MGCIYNLCPEQPVNCLTTPKKVNITWVRITAQENPNMWKDVFAKQIDGTCAIQGRPTQGTAQTKQEDY